MSSQQEWGSQESILVFFYHIFYSSVFLVFFTYFKSVQTAWIVQERKIVIEVNWKQPSRQKHLNLQQIQKFISWCSSPFFFPQKLGRFEESRWIYCTLFCFDILPRQLSYHSKLEKYSKPKILWTNANWTEVWSNVSPIMGEPSPECDIRIDFDTNE